MANAINDVMLRINDVTPCGINGIDYTLQRLFPIINKKQHPRVAFFHIQLINSSILLTVDSTLYALYPKISSLGWSAQIPSSFNLIK